MLKYLGPNPKDILGGILKLNLTFNNGGAFSFGASNGRAFSIFALSFLAVLFYIVKKIDENGWSLTLGALGGGVLGNLSDRIFRAPGGLNGGVVDWIQIPHWPIFNFADIAVTVSLLIVAIFLSKKRPLNSQKVAK